MLMLYVIMVNGTIAMQNIDINLADYNCLVAAEEIRKSDKVSDAFCVIADPKDETKSMIGRHVDDGKAPH